MKKKFRIFLLSAMVAIATMSTAVAEDMGEAVAGSTSIDEYIQDAYTAATNGTEIQFKYNPRETYTIYCQDGFVTDIKFAPGETITYVGAGDTTRWIVDRSTSGAAHEREEHVYIKPAKRGLSTNIIINTSRRTYQIQAISGGRYNPMVSWLIPGEDAHSLLIRNLEERREENFMTINAAALNFGYKINTARYSWSPIAVFDDGHKTYLRMKDTLTTGDAPALFLISKKGQSVLVNYRLVRGYYVLDRLIDRSLKLVVGQDEVTIKRQ